MLTGQPGLVVVGPDERLPARDVVELLRVRDVVPDGLQCGAPGQLVEGQLVSDTPVAHGDPVVGVPQHRLADAVVEGQDALLALEHAGYAPPPAPELPGRGPILSGAVPPAA